jgi:general secretion pathway protein G
MIIRPRAFTLIELLVVLAIIATLLSLVAPRYFKSIDRAKEAALQENLFTLRDALDKYHEDKGRYPNTLEELVSGRYLRKVPVDPITESSESWITVAPPDATKGGIFNVKSGAEGMAVSGTPFAEF